MRWELNTDLASEFNKEQKKMLEAPTTTVPVPGAPEARPLLVLPQTVEQQMLSALLRIEQLLTPIKTPSVPQEPKVVEQVKEQVKTTKKYGQKRD